MAPSRDNQPIHPIHPIHPIPSTYRFECSIVRFGISSPSARHQLVIKQHTGSLASPMQAESKLAWKGSTSTFENQKRWTSVFVTFNSLSEVQSSFKSRQSQVHPILSHPLIGSRVQQHSFVIWNRLTLQGPKRTHWVNKHRHRRNVAFHYFFDYHDFHH